MFFNEPLKSKKRKQWLCGRVIDGCPCSKGPNELGQCVSNHECEPFFEGDRWHCTRGESLGGPCAHGPLPDGTCCITRPYCNPIRSVTDRIYLAVKWSTLISIGLLILLAFGLPQEQVINPGPMSAGHAVITDCQACHHHPTEAGFPKAVETAFFTRTKTRLNNQCTACHEDLKGYADYPHNTEPEQLKNFTAEIRARTPKNEKVDFSVVRALTAPTHLEEGNISCAACHQEHKGPLFDLTEMPPNRCNVCHVVKAKNLVAGHNEYTNFPHEKRTGIIYDHVSHDLKHYKDKQYTDRAPGSCTSCHVIDKKNRRFTTLLSYEQSCAACHDTDITNSTQDNIPFLSIPYIDVETIQAQGGQIGEWPDTQAELSAFTQLLLANDERFQAYYRVMNDIDLGDLEGTDADTIAIVEGLVWAMKDLVYDLKTAGPETIQKRFVNAEDLGIAKDVKEALLQMPVDSFALAQESWFPNIEKEVSAYRAENPPKPFKIDVPPEGVEPEAGDDDLLDLGDLSEWGDDTLLEEEEEEEEAESQALTAHEWMKSGGWYFDVDSLAYRPHGHEDRFIRSWADVAGNIVGEGTQKAVAGDVLKSLMLQESSSPGACAKCHAVDQVKGLYKVHWMRDAKINLPKAFTRFAHDIHVTLLGKDQCTKCHVINEQAPYADGYNDLNPLTFQSNFKNIEKSLCVECHNSQGATDECTNCHTYHVGRILEQQKSPKAKSD